MSKFIKSTAVLVAICAVMTFLLAVTNEITAPIIAANESAKADGALLEVMPDGGSFELMDTEVELPDTVTEVYSAKNGGYVFKLTTSGYSTGMVLMCGVSADGKITGVSCIANNETPSIGGAAIGTYADQMMGQGIDSIDAVDTVTGATTTTKAYRAAVKDALNAAIILGGGSVDLRTEEEILADNLAAALPAAEGTFEKYFFVEIVEGVDAIYTATNGAGYVCVVGETFVGVDANENAVGEVSVELVATATAAVATISATETTDVILTDYEGLPSQLISAQRTASGNYVIEIKGAGYGIQGGNEYHPASGEYIIIRVSMTAEGKIIDCLTVSQKETDGIGSVCADEKFYGQFDGKTEENYNDIDAIGGATLTTNGYKKAILRAFESVKIFEGRAE